MVRVASWAAAVVAALGAVVGSPAHSAENEDATALLFSGRDLWRNGVFAYGGFLVAPSGFAEDGLLLKVLLSAGAYRYRAGDLDNQTVTGVEAAARVLPGWRIKRQGVEAKFFFGPDLQWHGLWPDDSGNRLRGTAIGLRVAVETWTEPTPETMVAADLSVSSIATSWSGRIAGGWRVLEDMFEDGFYMGPEAQYFASDGYRHLRLGAHLTGLKTDTYEWSAAAGWARASDGEQGPYVRLNVVTRR